MTERRMRKGYRKLPPGEPLTEPAPPGTGWYYRVKYWVKWKMFGR